MSFVFAALLLVLLAAGAVLIWEARTGRFSGTSARWETGRVILFFLAAVAGSALLIRAVDTAALMGLALVPVTALSLVRFVALARRRWGGWAPAGLAMLALLAGIGVSLLIMPDPLGQTSLVRHILDGSAPQRSIDPEARFTVRS